MPIRDERQRAYLPFRLRLCQNFILALRMLPQRLQIPRPCGSDLSIRGPPHALRPFPLAFGSAKISFWHSGCSHNACKSPAHAVRICQSAGHPTLCVPSLSPSALPKFHFGTPDQHSCPLINCFNNSKDEMGLSTKVVYRTKSLKRAGNPAFFQAGKSRVSWLSHFFVLYMATKVFSVCRLCGKETWLFCD